MIPQFFVRCTKLPTALGLAALFVLFAAQPAWAATRTVDTLDDNAGLTTCSAAANDCSLRGALSGASANDTIAVHDRKDPLFLQAAYLSSNKAFQRAVLQLAGQLRKAHGLSSSAQLDELAKAETLRRAMHPQFYAKAGP